MELYHLHTKGVGNNSWKAKKEIFVSEDFSNRLNKRIKNFSCAADDTNLRLLTDLYGLFLEDNGFTSFDEYNLNELIDIYRTFKKDPEIRSYYKELLKQSSKIILDASVFKREMAMEEFRKDNYPKLPSRLHCIYALDLESVPYWRKRLLDGDLELFRIDVLGEVFETSEQFIPAEHLSYSDFYDASYNYWNPYLKNIETKDREYLVRGKVRILEKVDEFKRK